MANRLDVTGFVLGTKLAGEQSQQVHFFSSTEGRLVCFQRLSKLKALPGLFDYAQCTLDSKHDGPWFVRDYTVLAKHPNIAKTYATLYYASHFARILFAHLEHADYFADLHMLCAQTLGAFEAHSCPEAIMLKALYKLASLEGFAIRESWLISLPSTLQADARSVIFESLQGMTLPASRLQALIANLQHWAHSETPFRFDFDPKAH